MEKDCTLPSSEDAAADAFFDALEAGVKPSPDLKNARRVKQVEGAPEIRTPPHSEEAEQGVLGCILLEPNPCMAESVELLNENPEVFYDLRNQTIYRTLLGMSDKQEPIDLITVIQKLKDANKLDECGGFTYISHLPNTVPSAANLSYYAEIVTEKYLLRRLIESCTNAIGRIYKFEGEVEKLLDEVESEILGIRASTRKNGATKIGDIIPEAVDLLEQMYNRDGSVTGIPTGFVDLDKMTDGLHPGEMIVLAARPGCGKTSIAMNIAEYVGVDLGIPVGVFSLEMTKVSLTQRMICSRAKVNARTIRKDSLQEREAPKLVGSAGKLKPANIYIDDTGGLSIMQLKAKARLMWQQHGIKLLVIDYLQLLHSTSRKASGNREQEVSDIANGIKSLAKELNIPIIAISQLNREVEKEKCKRPKLSQLRESGSLEQNADLAAFLYQENKDDDTSYEDIIPVKLFVAKQRNGPIGDVNLTFFKQFTRFESAPKIERKDVPEQPKNGKTWYAND